MEQDNMAENLACWLRLYLVVKTMGSTIWWVNSVDLTY